MNCLVGTNVVAISLTRIISFIYVCILEWSIPFLASKQSESTCCDFGKKLFSLHRLGIATLSLSLDHSDIEHSSHTPPYSITLKKILVFYILLYVYIYILYIILYYMCAFWCNPAIQYTYACLYMYSI